MQKTCSLSLDRSVPLVCISSLLSFFCGVGIGGNDLSANFAMVVGSGSLSMRQAIFYCTILELLGAIFMGGHVGRTIREGIVDPVLFVENKEMVLIGMVSASFSAALWLYLSTVFGLPVSITHTVVGTIIGFAFFTTGSFEHVQWLGVVKIIISWLAAPFVSALVTVVIFYFLRVYILDVEGRSFQNAIFSLPYCLGFSLLIIFMFIVIEQPSFFAVTIAKSVPMWVQYIIIFAVIVFTCQLFALVALPRLEAEAMGQHPVSLEAVGSSTETTNTTSSCEADLLRSSDHSTRVFCGFSADHMSPSGSSCKDVNETRGSKTACSGTYGSLSDHKMTGSKTELCTGDVFNEEDLEMSHLAPLINFNGTMIRSFNPQAEYLFTGLQVIAGGVSSFVHGAVTGANATAAFLILYEVFMVSELGQDRFSSGWVLLPALLGIAVGMSTLGGRLMKTVGMDLVALTPTRGWCIQVGGTFVTMVLTGVGVPVSLTQAQVGAAVGCGMLDAQLKGVLWGIVVKIFCGWAVTFFIAGVTTGFFMWLLYIFYCV